MRAVEVIRTECVPYGGMVLTTVDSCRNRQLKPEFRTRIISTSHKDNGEEVGKMRVLERMRGQGVLTDERGEKQRVTYNLQQVQDLIAVGPGEPPLLGLKSVVGTVLPVVAMWGYNVLEMSDGRKFKFFYHHSDGFITSTGPIE